MTAEAASALVGWCRYSTYQQERWGKE